MQKKKIVGSDKSAYIPFQIRIISYPVLKFPSSVARDDENGQMIGSRRFDVARYYHVTIGRTTGTTETYQNLANNSDAVGTSLRIFHKS